jgi:hypothetical protein
VWDILIQKVEIEGQKKCPVDLTRQPSVLETMSSTNDK